jgi:hypothetical protein
VTIARHRPTIAPTREQGTCRRPFHRGEYTPECRFARPLQEGTTYRRLARQATRTDRCCEAMAQGERPRTPRPAARQAGSRASGSGGGGACAVLIWTRSRVSIRTTAAHSAGGAWPLRSLAASHMALSFVRELTSCTILAAGHERRVEGARVAAQPGRPAAMPLPERRIGKLVQGLVVAAASGESDRLAVGAGGGSDRDVFATVSGSTDCRGRCAGGSDGQSSGGGDDWRVCTGSFSGRERRLAPRGGRDDGLRSLEILSTRLVPREDSSDCMLLTR